MNLTKLLALFGATILLSNYLPAQDDVDIEDADEVEELYPDLLEKVIF